MLQKVATFAPDLVLASGDLSEDASLASYQALQAYFKPLGIPVLGLPGNHDDAGLLTQHFPGSPVDEIVVSEHGQWQIIRLNSCLDGKPEGHLSKHTLEQLSQVLSEARHFQLIAMHHQPIPVDSPWIDKYMLSEPGYFLQLLDQAPRLKAVVWGHVHQVSEACRGGVAMWGSPSSAVNSVPRAEKFTRDSSMGPACRWLELVADGSVRTGIILT